MEKYYRQYDTCRQNDKPFCSNTCPFHVDVLDFQTKIAAGNYNAAFKVLRNSVAFPDIVAALCPEYCAAVCPRKDVDQAVQLSLLEKTCVAKATKKDPTDYNVPLKNRNIAIIGGGASGLACGVRLAQKKYNITIFEKTGRLGGDLWQLLPPEIFLEDINRQFKYEKVDFRFNTEVTGLEELQKQGFEAVYVATGAGGADFGLLAGQPHPCAMAGEMAVFAGGSLVGKEKIPGMALGLDMAWAIEVFLKTRKLEYPQPIPSCRAVADQDKLIKTPAVKPTEDGLFSNEETSLEAGRCIRCQCGDCMKYCDVCAYHEKWPMRIRDDIMATVAFSTSASMLKKTPAKKMMNTCTECGLCDEVCPEHIEIGGMLMEARRNLHKQGTMPGAYHQFWLRDMNFTNSESVALTKKAPGQTECAYAFFPGCQLGAAHPDFVMKPYQWLLSTRPDTGILLRCCSIPAHWAGNQGMHSQAMDELKREWESLGKPILIMACPACQKHLKEHLPEVQTTSLYEILLQWGFQPSAHGKEGTYSVFDPCTARHDEAVEKAVRTLAAKSGLAFTELPKGDMHGCCGYGGQVSVADPNYYAYVKTSRCRLSDNPYLVYCINCRDVFREDGKETQHILDILFPMENPTGPPPGLTQRRINRTRLKERLLDEIWKESMDMETNTKEQSIQLEIISEAVEKMNRMKVLEEDLLTVIEYAEKSNRRTFNPSRGTYTGYRESGHITYWVEYQKAGNIYRIVNVYTHRMKIKLEGVWNGRKTETDL